MQIFGEECLQQRVTRWWRAETGREARWGVRDLVGHPLRTASTRDGGIWTFQLGSKLGLNWSKQLAWKMGSKVSDIFTLSIAENQKLGTWERTGFDVVEQSRGWNSRGRLAEPLKTPERHEMQRRVRARRQKSDETASRLPTLRARAGRLARGGASRGGGVISSSPLLCLLLGLRLLLFDRRRFLVVYSGLAPLSTPPRFDSVLLLSVVFRSFRFSGLALASFGSCLFGFCSSLQIATIPGLGSLRLTTSSFLENTRNPLRSRLSHHARLFSLPTRRPAPAPIMSTFKRKAANQAAGNDAKKAKQNGNIMSFFAAPKPAATTGPSTKPAAGSSTSTSAADPAASKFDKQKWVDGLTPEQRELLQLEIDTLDVSWLALLKDEILTKEFLDLKRWLARETREKRTWFPPQEDVYSWYPAPVPHLQNPTN